MTTEAPPFQILLAEDSASDVGLVRVALCGQTFPYELHVAHDGAQAIAFIENADRDAKAPGIDLLLLDMHLPKYNGEDILKRLRSTERCAQTPVIVMSGFRAPADSDTAQRHAALHYFAKPSRLEDFMMLGSIVRDILTGTKGANGSVWQEEKRGGGA